ncbi:MAG: hypothetical protein KGV46_02600 [Pasteurella sp.]|nr:hypothetical protein [Pasteurella sp.]
MKIAILNYSGNVGKTTIARDVFSYRLPNYELINIESVNNDGKESVVIRGEEGDKLYTEIILNDDLILDIGSSNLESFFRTTQKESEIIDSMDVFIIPVTPEKKQQQDTIKTLIDLIKMKVKPSAIHIIFNQVIDDPMVSADEVFDVIIEGAKKTKVNANLKNMIFKHDLYNYGQTLAEMASDVDYRIKMEEAKAAGESAKAREYAQKYVRQRKIKKLDETYQAIFDSVGVK